ncbi:MAG: trypsin-like peptidase domain-containing protein [Clostridia bacterium]|nr:trypsin-like peptidase domain-containing protein [Clostridia bacterium]
MSEFYPESNNNESENKAEPFAPEQPYEETPGAAPVNEAAQASEAESAPEAQTGPAYTEQAHEPSQPTAERRQASGEYSYSFRSTNDPRGQGYDPYSGARQQYPPRGFYPPEGGMYPPRSEQYPPRSEQYPPRQEQYPPRGYYETRGNEGYGYGYGYRDPNAGYGYAPHPAEEHKKAVKEKKKKEKKSGRGLTTAIIVIICLFTVAASCLMGYVGAYLYRKNVGVSNDTSIIYRSVDTKDDSEAGDVATVAATVADSVVEITTERVTTSYYYGQYITKGAGSGVIISDNGYIITNQHVVADDNDNVADKIVVRLHSGEEYEAKVIGRDEDADIAVIKIEATGLSAAVWGSSDDLVAGEQIVVVGNPLGKLGGSIATGVIGALSREITIDGIKMNLIQLDAHINPGNSGGGVFNLKGELVGIVNAKSSGEMVEGLGFAIPEKDALSAAEQLIQYGYVKGKPYLGVTFYTANNSSWFSTSTSTTLYVYSCDEGLNDDVLKYGDQIETINGQKVTTVTEVKAAISKCAIGDKVSCTLVRNGKTMEVELEIFEYKPDTDTVNFRTTSN